MNLPQTTFNDLPSCFQGYIVGFSSTPIELETVSKDFRKTTIPAALQDQINCLLENKNCKQAMERFNLIPRSFSELKHTYLEKIKSITRAVLPKKISSILPLSIQIALQPSYISPKEVYRSLYINLKTLKQSIKKDVPDEALRDYPIQEMIASPQKLTEYLDNIYLNGIGKILCNTKDLSPTAKTISQQISKKTQISASKAVQIAFKLAKRQGPKIAEELKGNTKSMRKNFLDWSKTTWFADPTFYPKSFINLLQSPSVKLIVSGKDTHKPYCYCQFAPDNCRLSRKLYWQKQKI